MAYTRRANPEFSWSNSRKELFEDCKRAYYHQYYGAHNGWEKETEYEAWKTHRLKKTLPLKLAFAEAVQGAACRFFARPDKVTKESFKEVISQRLRALCGYKLTDWENKPSGNQYILERLNFEGGLSNEAVKKVSADIIGEYDAVTDNFFASPTVQDVKEGAEVVENYEDMDSHGWFVFKGNKASVKIWSKTDNVIKVGDKYIATVWKTGVSKNRVWHDEELQAKVLAVYIFDKYRPELKDIEVRVTDLHSGETRTYGIESMEEHRKVILKIASSIGLMMGYIRDKNINENQALPMDEFPVKEDDVSCRYCRYFGMCHGKDEVDARWEQLREKQRNRK